LTGPEVAALLRGDPIARNEAAEPSPKPEQGRRSSVPVSGGKPAKKRPEGGGLGPQPQAGA
jgi:hypothetical protein